MELPECPGCGQSVIDDDAEECPFCDGVGRILAPETVIRRIERSLDRAVSGGEDRGLTLVVHPSVALYLLEKEPRFLKQRQEETGLKLSVRDDPLIGLGTFRILAGRSDSDVTTKYSVR